MPKQTLFETEHGLTKANEKERKKNNETANGRLSA